MISGSVPQSMVLEKSPLGSSNKLPRNRLFHDLIVKYHLDFSQIIHRLLRSVNSVLEHELESSKGK